MKSKFILAAIAIAFAGNVYAASEISDTDMQAAFQQNEQVMPIANLSGQEMKATEGASLPVYFNPKYSAKLNELINSYMQRRFLLLNKANLSCKPMQPCV